VNVTLIDVDTTSWPGDCHIYELSEPHEGHAHIAVSVFDENEVTVTLVMPTTAEGAQVPNEAGALYALTQLPQTTHADALGALGYQETTV
jgi:hypothetical protein